MKQTLEVTPFRRQFDGKIVPITNSEGTKILRYPPVGIVMVGLSLNLTEIIELSAKAVPRVIVTAFKASVPEAK